MRAFRFLKLGIVVLIVLSFASDGMARSAKEKKSDEEIQVFKREQVADPTEEYERKGPGLTAEEVIRVFTSQAQAKRDEAIRILRELIRETPNNASEKPELLFRLSELMWEKANFFRMRAFSYDPAIWEAERTDPARHAQLNRMKLEDLELARQHRADTLRLYEAIYNHFPNYERMDYVLFYMGFNYNELGEEQKAQEYLRDLIRRFPNSDYIPDAYLAFGEFFFGIDQVEQALRFYQRAAEFKERRTYGFALYKMGWCLYNLGEHRKSLQAFIEVIEYSDSQEASGDQNRLSLKREATGDLVMAYSHVGRGSNAIEFFQTVAPDDYMRMAERLARRYTSQGMIADANALYRELIALNIDSPKVIDYEHQIVLNVERLGDRSTTADEASRLVELFNALVENGTLTGSDKEKAAGNIMDVLREYATTWHREAQVTRTEEHYEYAYRMYRVYVENFPDSEDIYLMTFYYAELLYSLEKWEDAAQAYASVVAMDEEGEHSQNAVHAMVLAYQRLMDSTELERQQRADFAQEVRSGQEKQDKEDHKAKVVEKLPFTERHQRFIDACHTYVRLVPDGDYIVDVRYFIALAYYDHKHFREAIAMFDDIIDNHPNHRLAVYAANLSLDSYNALGDYAGLNQAVRKYLAIDGIAHGRLLEVMESIREAAAFKASLMVEEEKNYVEAAEAFVAFVNEFPQTDDYDKALYNAALNYERANLVDKAIEIRVRLIQDRPNSDLIPQAFYAIGGNFQAIAIYSESARFYELFADRYPKDENAQTALNNAAIFRQGLGENEKALENFSKYIKLYGRQNQKRASLVFFQMGTIYEEEKQWKRVIDHYREYLRRWSKHQKQDRVVMAWTKIGLANKEIGNRGEAEKAFGTAVDIFRGIDEEELKGMMDGIEAAAHARYQLGEYLFEDYKEIQLDDAKKIQEQLGEKIKRLVAAQEVYEDVLRYLHPNWVIAAWGRIGGGWMELAATLRNSPPPPELDEEELYVYQDELDQQALQFDYRAIEAYKRCLDFAHQLRWFNEYTTFAERDLHRLNPGEFRMDSEIRAQPAFLGEGFRWSSFVTSINGEKR